MPKHHTYQQSKTELARIIQEGRISVENKGDYELYLTDGQRFTTIQFMSSHKAPGRADREGMTLIELYRTRFLGHTFALRGMA